MTTLAFVAETQATYGTLGATKSITLPVCQVGDLLVLAFSGGAELPNTPAGWGVIESASVGGAIFGVGFQRIAQAGDSGSTLTFTSPNGNAKVAVTAAAYRPPGSTPIVVSGVLAETVSDTVHGCPHLTFPPNYVGWVISILFRKEDGAASTVRTPPVGFTKRTTGADASTGGTSGVMAIIADSTADVTYSNPTWDWTTDAASRWAAVISFAVSPVTDQTLVRPTSTPSSTGWTAQGAASIHAALADDDGATYGESGAGGGVALTERLVMSAKPDQIAYTLSSNGATAESWTVVLKQGATTIATWTDTGVHAVETEVVHTLTGGEKAAITGAGPWTLDVLFTPTVS